MVYVHLLYHLFSLGGPSIAWSFSMGTQKVSNTTMLHFWKGIQTFYVMNNYEIFSEHSNIWYHLENLYFFSKGNFRILAKERTVKRGFILTISINLVQLNVFMSMSLSKKITHVHVKELIWLGSYWWSMSNFLFKFTAFTWIFVRGVKKKIYLHVNEGV